MADRVVFDTNVLVSAALFPNSIPGRAVYPCTYGAAVLFSAATFAEIREVLWRPKFDAYLSEARRHEYVRFLLAYTERIQVANRIEACRDPRDDKFLDVAVSGQADCLVTGDGDLLVLDPFMGISIVTPESFLKHLWP